MTRLALLLALILPAAALAAEPPPAGRWQGVVRAGDQSVSFGLRLEPHGGGTSCLAYFTTQPNPPRCTVAVEADGKLTVVVAATSSRMSLNVTQGGAVLEGTYSSPTAAGQSVRLTRAAEGETFLPDPAPHRERFVTTSDGVRLEVLDYGGEGTPIILIPGLGAGAHVFDPFAPRLAANHRVIAFTPRGFGLSDTPPLAHENFTARRHGDDVLEVMAALGIERAAVAAWSIGGEYVSSVASRRPEKVSAAIYLDGAYAYSFYSPENFGNPDTNLNILVNELGTALAAALAAPGPQSAAERLSAIRRDLLPQLTAQMEASEEWLNARGPRPPGLAPPPPPPVGPTVSQLILAGAERFGPLSVPTLAIFATEAPAPRPELRANIDRYHAGNPRARILEIPGGDHAIFISHPEESLEAMEDLLGVPARSASTGGEAAVRKLAADIARGAPDYARMTPAQALTTRGQLDTLRANLRANGDIRAVTLIAAARDGRDRYRVQGASGALEYSIALAPDGTLRHFSQKVLERGPAPGGEAALRKIIADVKRGEPDYATMSSAMQNATRTQLATLQQSFNALGEIRSFTLIRADPSGRDYYRVEGATGAPMEFAIIFMPDGRVQNISFRALPATP